MHLLPLSLFLESFDDSAMRSTILKSSTARITVRKSCSMFSHSLCSPSRRFDEDEKLGKIFSSEENRQ